LLAGGDCLAIKAKALKFDPQVRAATEVSAVQLLNFDDIFCDDLYCLPVIGHAVVYRDDNHLTDTFARTLAPYIEQEINEFLKN
jgi:hypothetical protein